MYFLLDKPWTPYSKNGYFTFRHIFSVYFLLLLLGDGQKQVIYDAPYSFSRVYQVFLLKSQNHGNI